MEKNKNYLLLMMGGTGTRVGKDLPKQYVLVNGIPIFAYTLKTYDSLEYIDGIIIVADKYYENYIMKWIEKLHISKVISIVQCGEYRSKSVLNGIIAYKDIATNNDILIVHDASSPYVDSIATHNAIVETNKGFFTTLGVKQTVTVYEIDEKTGIIKNVIPREKVIPGACPDIFQYGKVYNIYVTAKTKDLEKMTSALALGVANNIPSKVILTSMLTVKITYSEDIRIFRKLVDTYYFPNFKEKYIDLLEIDRDLIKI